MHARRRNRLATADRASRSLKALNRTASTSRVLNLLSVAEKHGGRPDWSELPLFKSRALNASIILKHRLRADEVYMFDDYRTTATKVIIPFERSDLGLGGQSFFVGQRGWLDLMYEACAENRSPEFDIGVLRLMDRLPSLDPFLLREHLRRHGHAVAPCYFAISPADLDTMQSYAAAQIEELIRLAYRSASANSATYTVRLVQALLSTEVDERLEPLRDTLMLEGDDFREGVFSWKGFLYYKWMLTTLQPQLNAVAGEIGDLMVSGPRDPEVANYIDGARKRLKAAIGQCRKELNRTLRIYDTAFAGLTQNGNPLAFRRFLLDAPEMFLTLGERVGAASHVASFWRYRFPQGRAPSASAEEVVDIFQDFEASLGETLAI